MNSREKKRARKRQEGDREKRRKLMSGDKIEDESVGANGVSSEMFPAGVNLPGWNQGLCSLPHAPSICHRSKEPRE